MPRMFALHTIVDGQDTPQHTPLATVDTDTWHRRIGARLHHALKQPAGENNIDRSGAETSSEIGEKNEMSRKRTRRWT